VRSCPGVMPLCCVCSQCCTPLFPVTLRW
jgi:hypothetical protein